MAFMMREKLPYGATTGEKRVFDLLQKLPDDCIVYYEPRIENLYPDFVVIIPEIGVLIIEVKGWRFRDISRINMEYVLVNGQNDMHPLRQARNYMFKLLGRCRSSKYCPDLLHKSGQYQGKLKIPFSYMTVLTNITSEQIQTMGENDLTQFFPATNTLLRDEMLKLQDSGKTPDEMLDFFRRFFNAPAKWPMENGRMTEEQIKQLRAVIFPEIVIEQRQFEFEPDASPAEVVRAMEKSAVVPAFKAKAEKSVTDKKEGNVKAQIKTELVVLDLKQEQMAARIRSGHRLIFGVAGSGKTVVLIARAKRLAEFYPQMKILVTCYNITLAAFLRHAFKGYKNIDVLTFHSLVSRVWGLTINIDEDNSSFGDRVYAYAENENVPPLYDTILIDEAQDFDPAWFKILLLLMKDPEDGDLLIVGDAMQGLYKSRHITWKSLGIQAAGHTRYLHKNYRNSREIVSLAVHFSKGNDVPYGDEAAVEAMVPSVDDAVRESGIKPLKISGKSVVVVQKIMQVLQGLLNGTFVGRKGGQKLRPADIAVLYPAKRNVQYLLELLIDELNKKSIPVLWANTPANKKDIGSSALKIMTMHSSKGLQFRAVVILGADAMPRTGSCDEDEKLMYVALTRAEDYLIIADTGRSSGFIDRFKTAEELYILDDYDVLADNGVDGYRLSSSNAVW